MDSASFDKPTDEARGMPPHSELDSVDKPEEETDPARDRPPDIESGTLDKPEEDPCAAKDPLPDGASVPVMGPNTDTASVTEDHDPTEAHSWGDLFKHFMFHVTLPRDLMIRSERLGISQIILQVLMVLVLVVYVIFAEIWTSNTHPDLHSEWVYLTAPADAARAADTNVQHCTSSDAYNYTWASGRTTSVYAPEGCENISMLEAFAQRGSSIILATYITEVARSGTSGQECLVMNRECQHQGREFVFLTPTTCECRRTRQFFARNAEETGVAVFRGLTAENLPPWRKVLVTRFLRHDGTPCQVGGREEVRTEEAGLTGGFQGSIREWLSCAGVTLDTHPVDMGLPDDGGTTFLRTMGMNLVFQLHYTNVATENVSEVICSVTPIAEPRWTTSSSYQVRYRDFSETHYEKVDRTIHGVHIKFKVTGDLRYFDWKVLIQGVINVLFLLTVPQQVLVLVSTLCLGSVSMVYNHARSLVFDMHEQLRVALAKSMFPLTAFRSFLGGEFEGSVSDMDPVYRVDLRNCLQDTFAAQISCGQFEDRHINRMVMMLCKYRGEGDPGTFDHKTFERICMKNEMIGSEALVSMFHYRRKKRALEKLMDDSGGKPDDDRLDGLFKDKRPKPKKKKSGKAVEEHEDLHRLWDQSFQQHKDAQDNFCEDVSEMRRRIDFLENAIREVEAATKLAAARAMAAVERGEMTELLAQQKQLEADREGPRDRQFELENELDSCVRDGRSAKHEMTTALERLEDLHKTLESLRTESQAKKEERKDAKKTK